MKKTIAILSFVLTLVGASAQNVYWVFLADKAGTTFDPYTYFDQKALERYAQCGADLYDRSNYPLAEAYVAGVGALATEEVGQSRWLNAIGVVATPEQATAIARLPYVSRVQMIKGDMQLAGYAKAAPAAPADPVDTTLTDQLVRMQGHLFRQAGIDGTGIRIAVFDGGFPKVNTHEAFRHLREGKRILQTWNFPNKKEDVYGWNSHGTMTLSCIAGRMNGKDLGLATGAEFLLARTEVEPEPFKEEIWWQQAVEWADKGGANIISSSLGYGKDRYYTKDMDGQSYVARAANMAARKGILVVCSAGNEADDDRWQYLVTPSDADSALCIGGITHSLTDYEHISFASFGPSADGRQKPNLCAFAHTWAASPKNNGAYEMVYGTSFSCPLVAGFAACAWQASKGMTNMQLFDALQRSADLYPYCDYAFGYGVPQAGYFLDKKKSQSAPTFRFETQGPTRVSVIPLRADTNVHVFYKDIDDATGRILMYGKRTVALFDTAMSLDIDGGHHLVVYMDGYMADYRFERPSNVRDKHEWAYIRSNDPKKEFRVTDALSRAPAQDVARESRSEWDGYFQLGLPVAMGDELDSRFWSPAKRIGVRWQYHISKAYGWGLALEYGHTAFCFGDEANRLDSMALMDDDVRWLDKKVTLHRLDFGEVGIELFQRVRFTPGGLFHKGFHWDLGIYGNWGYSDYNLKGSTSGDIASSRLEKVYNLSMLDGHRWNYGLTTRLANDWYGLYVRYRLNGLGQEVPAGRIVLPRLEVGLQLLF